MHLGSFGKVFYWADGAFVSDKPKSSSVKNETG